MLSDDELRNIYELASSSYFESHKPDMDFDDRSRLAGLRAVEAAALAESQHFAIADANKTLIIAGGDTIEEVTDDMVGRAARKIADMDGRTWESLPEGIARDQYTLIAHGALSAGMGIHDHDPGGCTCGCPLLECGRCGESTL